MNKKKIIGAIILAPFLIPMTFATMATAAAVLITGFPIYLGLSLLEDDFPKNIKDFYWDIATDFSIFPLKIMLGINN